MTSSKWSTCWKWRLCDCCLTHSFYYQSAAVSRGLETDTRLQPAVRAGSRLHPQASWLDACGVHRAAACGPDWHSARSQCAPGTVLVLKCCILLFCSRSGFLCWLYSKKIQGSGKQSAASTQPGKIVDAAFQLIIFMFIALLWFCRTKIWQQSWEK